MWSYSPQELFDRVSFFLFRRDWFQICFLKLSFIHELGFWKRCFRTLHFFTNICISLITYALACFVILKLTLTWLAEESGVVAGYTFILVVQKREHSDLNFLLFPHSFVLCKWVDCVSIMRCLHLNDRLAINHSSKCNLRVKMNTYLNLKLFNIKQYAWNGSSTVLRWQL